MVNKKAKEKHYSRNENNETPETESEAKESELGFVQLPKEKSIYHMQGDGGDKNKKYVSEDGKNEAVYGEDGNLVTDDVNQGTYNFASPTEEPVQHVIKGVIPYFIYGNTPDDPTTVVERIFATYEGDVNAKKD